LPGFEKWFGVRPEVTPELRELLTADGLGMLLHQAVRALGFAVFDADAEVHRLYEGPAVAASKRAATVDLPIPIEPVRPITSISAARYQLMMAIVVLVVVKPF
jgi:hypothetical protein